MEEKIVTSSNIESQLPDFIREDSGNFNDVLKSYYKSLERSSYPLDLLFNLTKYFDLDTYTSDKLVSSTVLINNTEKTDDSIIVSSTSGFPDNNGTLQIENELVFYEYKTSSPKIKFLPNLNEERVKSRFVILDDITNLFDGIRTRFDLNILSKNIFTPSVNHILVKFNDLYLEPGLDYFTVNENDSIPPGVIEFAIAPSESTEINVNRCEIEFLQGYITDSIVKLDEIESPKNKKIHNLKYQSSDYFPITDSYILVFKNRNLLQLNSEYSLTDSRIIFKNNLSEIDDIFIISIEAQVPKIGTGAKAYTIINDDGQLDKIVVENSGFDYKLDESPKVQIYSENGDGATAYSLVNGIKSISVVDGGFGYDEDNPPNLSFNLINVGNIETKVTIKNESISSIEVLNSGFGITTTPRITVNDPVMPTFGSVTIEPTVGDDQAYVITGVEILNGGSGLTKGPKIYIDAPPFGDDKLVDRPQIATITPVVSNGIVVDLIIDNSGLGFDPQNPPRVKAIDYRNAEILDIKVVDGSVTAINILSGGHGYTESPSIYIIDNRYDAEGNYIGGNGAKAKAIIFNGSISDIIIEDFGTRYDDKNPPIVYISSPKKAQLVSDIGNNEITGFEVVERGFQYNKSAFLEVSRGFSGLSSFDDSNILFSQSDPECHAKGSIVKNVYADYLKYFLNKIKNQFLPEFPNIDFEKYDIRNLIKKIKDFYSIKGTKTSVESFFYTVFDDVVEVSYPKDQIMRPSDALWSSDTIMRVELIKGNINNILGNLIYQKGSDVDPNVVYSESIVDSITTIQTTTKTIYELVLDTNTYIGNFLIPYSTKLTESIDRDDITITVDSTIGWPESNGYFYVGNELITYKSKSLNQFLECRRGVNGVLRSWTGGTKLSTNFYLYYNEGQDDEVIIKILGVSKTESTVVDDGASNYIEGDILSLSDLGTDKIQDLPGNKSLITSWIYNVKKIKKINSIELTTKSNKFVATVTVDGPHGLLRGKTVDIFGSSPSFYNGRFSVENINVTEPNVFDYVLDITPEEYDGYISTYPTAAGDIYLSIPLEKGKSQFRAIDRIVSQFTSDVQNSYISDEYIWIASSGIPSYEIGETGGEVGFKGNALLPGNQRYLKRFPKKTEVVSNKFETQPGQIGTFLNGIPIYNYKSKNKVTFGSISEVTVLDSGFGYDVEFDPEINVYKTVTTISGKIRIKNPEGVKLKPLVNGSIIDVEVINGGSGFTEPPVLTVSGGGGTGAFLTAVLSGGRISRVVIDSRGSEYFQKPVINIVGGGGSGAILEPIVRGSIEKVQILNSGLGFEEIPEIEVNTGGGARAQAIILNGRIRSIGLLSSGSGYTTPPLVVISDPKGKNALAKTILYRTGPNKGSIERIVMLNAGSGYNQNTTKVEILPIGSGAKISCKIFEWIFDLNKELKDKVDPKNGYVFVGKNNQFGSEYGHISNPKYLRYLLGDNVLYNELLNKVTELQIGQVTRHSPIIGWSFDGNPIYGPYAYTDPSSLSPTNNQIIPMRSGWKLKTSRDNGPSINKYPLGTFVEDYEYSLTAGVTLDRYNGRFCKTPEFPDGVYAYFVTVDGTIESIEEFPYIIGNEYYALPDVWNLSSEALQTNIPTDVIRYRVPYEGTDVDIARKLADINASLSTEDNQFNFVLESSQEIIGYDDNGDPIYKTYPGYDINDDTFITDDEIYPIELVEESDIEIYDYFPKTEKDANVEIKVSNVNKFESSTIDNFDIENGGQNYKVGDIIQFDISESGGNLPSAIISAVSGNDIDTLSFIKEDARIFGKLITINKHGLTFDDNFKIQSNPRFENVDEYQPYNYRVIVINGIENVSLNSFGVGYSKDIKVNFRFFDNIDDIELKAIIDNNGSLNFIEVLNSGSTDLDRNSINISIDPPTEITQTQFFSVKVKNDRTANLRLPQGTLDNIESGQVISNDVVLDSTEINFIECIPNISLGNTEIKFNTVDQNLVQQGKIVNISGFTSVTSINGNKTVSSSESNYFSIIENGTSFPQTIDVESKDWKKVSSSQNGAHTLALKQDNTLWSWGLNQFGQLGIGNRTRKKIPVKVSNDTWIKISSNGNKSLAIKSDGTLWSWGQNFYGELGVGDSVNRIIPTQVGIDDDWIEVSSGANHTLAIKSNGTLWSWGRNSFGNLGDGTIIDRYSPVQVGSSSNWTNVSAGNSISAAIDQDGYVYVWGDSRNSCLGLGNIVSITLTFSEISGTFVPDQIVNFELSGAYGKVVSWNPTTRLLILKNFTYTNLPTRREKIYIGSDIETSTNYGRINSIRVFEPKDFGSFLEINSGGSGVFLIGETITSSRGVTATVVAFDINTRKLEISNRTGEFLVNDTITGSTSKSIHTFKRYIPQSSTRILIPTKVTSDTWSYVYSTNRSTFAIKTNGTLWSWGDNFYGNLGTGDLLDRNIPTQIGSDNTWIKVSPGTAHVLAISESDNIKTLYAWGRSSSYELGDGLLTNRLSPIEITSITNIYDVESGNSCSFVIKDSSGNDYPLVVFGNSSQGRLGNNKFSGSQLTPIEIQSVSITLNPTSNIIESVINSIDSTNSIIKVSDIRNTQDEYPNESSYSNNDIIEIISDNDELTVNQVLEQELESNLEPFSTKIKLNNLTDVSIGKLINVYTSNKSFVGTIKNINGVLIIDDVSSDVEVYSGNTITFEYNNQIYNFNISGVLVNTNNTFRISLIEAVTEFPTSTAFEGFISENILTVTNVISGTILTGMTINSEGISDNTIITSQLSGSGLIGTYEINNSQNLSETTFIGLTEQSAEFIIPSYSVYDQNVIIISDIDEQNKTVTVSGLDNKIKTTLNPITLSNLVVTIYSNTLSNENFGLYNNTFFIINNFFDGQPIKYISQNTQTPLGGLISGTTYYALNTSKYSFQLSLEVDDFEAIQISSRTNTIHKFRSIIRKRIIDSNYQQNKITYNSILTDKNDNIYAFGQSTDEQNEKCVVFHKYNNFGTLIYKEYLKIPNDGRLNITSELFDINVKKSIIIDNNIYLVLESVYRQISSVLIRDLIFVKYDISAEQPLKLSTSVILSNGLYENEIVGLFKDGDYINIISNVYNYPGSEGFTSGLIIKIIEQQPTTIVSYSFTSNPNSVKLNNQVSNTNFIYVQNNLYENQPVVYTSFLPIGGLSANRVYYAINVDNEKFRLSETPNGTAVQLTSYGDTLPDSHSISPVLIPNFNVESQKRISFDNGLPIEESVQVDVQLKSFDTNSDSIILSATSLNRLFLIFVNKNDLTVDSILEVNNISTTTSQNHFVKYNQFNEIYLATTSKLFRINNEKEIITEVEIGYDENDFNIVSFNYDIFDNIVISYLDNSDSNSKISVNYFDYALNYKKTQIVYREDKDTNINSIYLDLFNTCVSVLDDVDDNFYNYIYKFDDNTDNSTINDVSIINSIDLQVTEEITSNFIDRIEYLTRPSILFANFSISDIDIYLTDCSNEYLIIESFEPKIKNKLNISGIKPKFISNIQKKFFISKNKIENISPIITFTLNKSVNYPVGSFVEFIQNEDLSKVYSATILEKSGTNITVSDFKSEDATLITDILSNTDIKLKNINPIYNSKINNTFNNNEKIEVEILISDVSGTFVRGDVIEFISGSLEFPTVQGQASVISYNSSTNIISIKNIFDLSISTSTFIRTKKIVAGELITTGEASFNYLTDFSYKDYFKFEMPAEYVDDYIFESDNKTNGSIISIEVVNGGNEYTVAPSVIVQNQPGVNGSGLVAIALLDEQNGTVNRILVENGGAKFTKIPNILLLGGDGQGATARVSRMRFTSEVYTLQVLEREQDIQIDSGIIYSNILLGDIITQGTASGTVISKNRDKIKLKLNNPNIFNSDSQISIFGVREVGNYSVSADVIYVSPCPFAISESVSLESVINKFDLLLLDTYYPNLDIINNNIININNLYGVSRINLISRLFEYVTQINESLSYENRILIESDTPHNISNNSIIKLDIDGYYSQINRVSNILSETKLIMNLDQINSDNPPHVVFDDNSSIFFKTPSFNMTYGHRYKFDLSHPSNDGITLSFSKDSLNKVIYTFINVERSTANAGSLGSYVQFYTDNEFDGQLAYYFNESSESSENNYSEEDAFISLRETPYNGRFKVLRVINDTELLFDLPYEPECNAYVNSVDVENTAKYVSYSQKSTGSISEISIFNSGGYFKVLPKVSGIICPRNIQTVEIINGGTEYEPGIYRDVPIQGNGTGAFVNIVVQPQTITNEDDEEIITGRITNVELINSGENYTNAFIDINSIPGILGSAFNGSGGILEVIIPAAGTEASILPYSFNVGRIRKLSSLNIGFDYTHDYTLKPQIKFPISLQLINANVISDIIITDPGFGYTSTPIVIIEGGGGTGAQAVATVKNNRVSEVNIVTPGSGYFSIPDIIIQSKIPYVVNQDLNLLQFKVPHGIPNKSKIKLRAEVVDNNINNILPLINYSGGMDALIDSNNTISGIYETTITLVAITGESNGLLTNQLRIAIDENEAGLNNYLTFSRTGSSIQYILTEVFGAKAEAILKLSEFLPEETINQIEERVINNVTTNVVTAIGRVLPNFGWISGPNIIRLNVDFGQFEFGKKIIGFTSKSSGVINKVISASGFGEIGSTSRIDGKFYEETGKLSSLSQKIQSTFYQDFAYLVKSNIPTQDWNDSVYENIHPAGFSLFSEFKYETVNKINRIKASSSFTRNISVDVAQSRLTKTFAPAYVEDVLNLNEVTVVGKNLITSESIISSFVEKIDDISSKFDGETKTFDLKTRRLITSIDGETTEVIDTVRNSENFLMIYLNNILQSRESYIIQNGQITFDEAPTPSLVTKSREIRISELYPPNTSFKKDEKLIVTRVKECNLRNINIYQYTINVVSSIDIEIKYGDIFNQNSFRGIVTEVSKTFIDGDYYIDLVIIAAYNGVYQISNQFTINNNSIQINVSNSSEPQIADLRYFTAHIISGSELVNTGINIFSYENIINDNDYSVNIRFYKIFDSLDELIIGNNVFLKLVNLDTRELQLSSTSDQINLFTSGIELISNSNIYSQSSSLVNIKYDINEPNLSITSVFTLLNFINHNTNTVSIPSVGDVFDSSLSGEICTILSVDEQNNQITVSIKSTINDPFIAENEFLQEKNIGVIQEGKDDNFIFFNNRTDGSKYKVSKIKYKSIDDNTISNFNTVLPVLIDNKMLISKTYGALDNTDNSSVFVQINDLIVGESSGVTAKVVDVIRFDEINEVVINNSTKFEGYIFNRRNNPDNPNITINDISKSYIVSNLKLESYENLLYKTVNSSRLLLDDYITTSVDSRLKSIELNVDYNESEEFSIDDIIEVVRVSVDIEESAGRFKDAKSLIDGNRQEIIDRSLAEIAIQHPDFVYPGDNATDPRYRFYDSYRLIQQNRTEIIDTAWLNMVDIYPEVSSTENKCKRDIGYFIDAISLDLFTGGNSYSRKFVSSYFDSAGRPISNGLVGEEQASISAFNEARDLMKLAITNQLTIKDLTLSVDPDTNSNTDPDSCANVQSNIDTLVSIVTTIITTSDLDSLPSENTGSFPTGASTCARDIGYIVDAVSLDIFRGSNINIVESARSYFNQNGELIYIIGEELETVTAFNAARDMMKKAITNQLYYKDLTLINDPDTNSNIDEDSCANVQSTIDTLVSIITTVITSGSVNDIPNSNPGRSFIPSEEIIIYTDSEQYKSNIISSDNVNYILTLNNLYDEDGLLVSQTENIDLASATIETLRPSNVINIKSRVEDCTVARTQVKSKKYYVETLISTTNTDGLYVGLTGSQSGINFIIDEIINGVIYVSHVSYESKQSITSGTITFNTIPTTITKTITVIEESVDTIISTSEIYPQINKYQQIPGTISNYTQFYDSYKVISKNISFISEYIYNDVTTKYPYLLTREGVDIKRCKTDISLITESIFKDIRDGGNYNIVLATKFYFDANNRINFLKNEIFESIYAYSSLKNILISAVRNFEFVKEVNLILSNNYIQISDTSGLVRGMKVLNSNITSNVYISDIDDDKVYLVNENGTNYIFPGTYNNEIVTFTLNNYRLSNLITNTTSIKPKSLGINQSNLAEQNISYLVDILLNSINPNPLSTYRQSVLLLKDEYEDLINSVYDQIVNEFPILVVPSQSLRKCQRDMKIVSDAVFNDLIFGGNIYTLESSDFYVGNNNLNFIKNEVVETSYTFYKLQLEYINIINESNFTTQQKLDINNRIEELFQILINKLTNNANGTVQDSSVQILKNAEFIVDEAFNTVSVSETFTSNEINDLLYPYGRQIISSLAKNILLGKNEYLVDTLPLIETTSEFFTNTSKKQYLREYVSNLFELSKLAIRNFIIDEDGTIYSPETSINFVQNFDILIDPSGWPTCASVINSINTYAQIADNYWNDGSLATKSLVIFNYEPKKLYPENYVIRPIRGGILENDNIIHKSGTYSTSYDNRNCLVNLVTNGISKVYDIEKRVYLTNTVGDLVKSPNITTTVFSGSSINVTITDINSDGSANIKFSGIGSQIVVGATLSQNNGFTSIISEVKNIYIIKNIEGEYSNKNYIFDIDIESNVESYIESYEKNSATITKSINDRLIFDSDSIIGEFTTFDYIYVEDTDYESTVQFSYKGFDSNRTTFDLTTTTQSGDVISYFPSAIETPIIVSIDGVIQNYLIDYSITSNKITFTTPPSSYADFVGIYTGQWRKLDNISNQFDGITQNFGMRINALPYSIGTFGNNQSILVERNCIFTLNGVFQTPQESFVVDGSRIRFSNPPKPGTEFIGYIYIGSNIDVDSIEVLPQVESNDIVRLTKEDTDRIVASVDSLRTINTFEYSGERIGRFAQATATIRSGKIKGITLTSSGDGYTRKPKCSIISSSGFDGNIEAQLGVSNISIINSGSGYLQPYVELSEDRDDFQGEILFEPDGFGLYKISIINIIKSGNGYSGDESVILYNVGNPSIPAFFKIITNEAGVIENIYPIVIGIIDIDEDTWSQPLFDQYGPVNFRIRGQQSSSEAVVIGGSVTTGKLLVKDFTGSFISGENINIVSNLNNISLGRLTICSDFYLNVGGQGYNPLRLEIDYDGSGQIPSGGFVRIFDNSQTVIEYQYDTISKLSDEELFININKSYSYFQNRDFYIGEKVSLFQRNEVGQSIGDAINFVVEEFNPITNKLKVVKPSKVISKIELNETGQISNITLINKGNNYYPTLDYVISIQGQSQPDSIEAELDISIGSVTSLKVSPFIINNIKYDGYGRNYSLSDSIIIQAIDKFGSTENVSNSGQGAFAKLLVESFENGEVDSIIIPENTRGSQYFTSPILITKGGSGFGVQVETIIENNAVKEVKLIKKGVGFETVPQIIFGQKLSLTKKERIRTYLNSNANKVSGLIKNIESDDTEIFVQTTGGFLGSGILVVGKELIAYTGVTENSFTGCSRGLNFNFDQKLTLSAGLWDFEIGDVLPIIRNISSESSTGISTNVRIYSYEPQNQLTNTPPILYIQYVIDELAFIDAGQANSTGNPSYFGGLSNSATSGSKLVNAQVLNVSNVDGISIGNIVSQDQVIDNNNLNIQGEVINIIYQNNQLVVKLQNNTNTFLQDIVRIIDQDNNVRVRFVNRVDKNPIHLFDTSKIVDGPENTDSDLLLKTFVVCPSDDIICNTNYDQIKGWKPLNQSIITENGLLVDVTIYPRNTSTGGIVPYGYISVKDFGVSSQGLVFSGVDNQNSEYSTGITLDGGNAYSLYGVDEINELGNTISVGDALRDGEGNISTVVNISAVNTGESLQSRMILTINKSTTFTDLQVGYKIEGYISGFYGTIETVSINENFIDLTLSNLVYSQTHNSFILNNQQGESLNIYDVNDNLITDGFVNKYLVKSFEFKSLVLSR
jgi:alpha-tubulin suppressor-like RCC1 family protein